MGRVKTYSYQSIYQFVFLRSRYAENSVYLWMNLVSTIPDSNPMHRLDSESAVHAFK